MRSTSISVNLVRSGCCCRNAVTDSAPKARVDTTAYRFRKRTSLSRFETIVVISGSVEPHAGVLARRRARLDSRGGYADVIGPRPRVPVVPHHRPVIREVGIGLRIGRRLGEVLELVDRLVEPEVVHVAGEEMQL